MNDRWDGCKKRKFVKNKSAHKRIQWYLYTCNARSCNLMPRHAAHILINIVRCKSCNLSNMNDWMHAFCPYACTKTLSLCSDNWCSLWSLPSAFLKLQSFTGHNDAMLPGLVPPFSWMHQHLGWHRNDPAVSGWQPGNQFRVSDGFAQTYSSELLLPKKGWNMNRGKEYI